MRRIVIVGCAGSGKSTLAQQLGAILKLEVVHLDTLYWKPNWIKTPEREWQEIIKGLLEKESWILDGNFSSSRRMRFDAADTIILLDFPRWLCLWRVIRRRFQFRFQDRPDRARGCSEQLNLYLLKHIWSFPSRLRPPLVKDVSEYSALLEVIVLRSPRQTRKFLASVETADRTHQP